jgi:hypothetical protein
MPQNFTAGLKNTERVALQAMIDYLASQNRIAGREYILGALRQQDISVEAIESVFWKIRYKMGEWKLFFASGVGVPDAEAEQGEEGRRETGIAYCIGNDSFVLLNTQRDAELHTLERSQG